ncbi:MAG: hypothetical protein ACKV19_22970 [Verrucomicrobiales bacterium]
MLRFAPLARCRSLAAMRFRVSSEITYGVPAPSTLILNVHAMRGSAQKVQEEAFVAEPAVRLEEFVVD